MTMVLMLEDLSWFLNMLLTTCVPGASLLVAVDFSFIIWLIGSTGVSHFSALQLAFCEYCLFCKLRVCGNPALRMSISTIFLIAFYHFFSLCNILVILFFIIKFLFAYLFWPHWSFIMAWAFSSCSEWGLRSMCFSLQWLLFAEYGL